MYNPFFRDTTEKAGVRTVHPRCSTGHIGWYHPYGAIRINFATGHNAPFDVCFIAKAHFTIATISLETVSQSEIVAHSRMVPVDITQSDDQSEHSTHSKIVTTDTTPAVDQSDVLLRKLVTFDTNHAQMTREMCIRSEKGEEVIFYLEAEMDLGSTIIGRVELEYDVEKKARRRTDDVMEGEKESLLMENMHIELAVLFYLVK